MTCRFLLDLAGYTDAVDVPRQLLATVHQPLVDRLAALLASGQDRVVAMLAGPPGSGKSTLAALLAQIGAGRTPPVPIQVLPMDGFHLSNAVLERRGIRADKGLPHTFDLPALRARLAGIRAGAATRWPLYDRRIHDPVPDALAVAATGVLLMEGQFLALDAPGWRELHRNADLSVFLECPLSVLRSGVEQRHRRGGRTSTEAKRQFDAIDRPNVGRILAHRCPTDVTLQFNTLRWTATACS